MYRARSLFTQATRSMASAKRVDCTEAKPVKACVALDVDGVLLRGNEPIKNAKEALLLMEKNKIPYMLVTNGGGYTESEKAHQISQIIGHRIVPELLQVAHSPYRALVDKYKDKNVLVVGKRKIHEIARSYGFLNTYDPLDIQLCKPGIFPSWHFSTEKAAEVDDLPPALKAIPNSRSDVLTPKCPERIDVVLTFLDPEHYHRDAQIIIDLVTSRQDLVTPSDVQVVPIHCSGPDIEYMTEWPRPRLGAGIFEQFVRHIHSMVSKRPIEMEMYGKPHKPTYTYADTKFTELCSGVPPDQVYMIGDNPYTDIKGAHDHGWKSVLVKTGVYDKQKLTNDTVPDHIAEDVLQAVQWVIAKSANNEFD